MSIQKVIKKPMKKSVGVMAKIKNAASSWVSMHYPTIKPLNKSHPDLAVAKIKNAPPGDENHFVYMIQEREFLKSGESVYKIGKTTQQPNSRLAGYPKGSRVIYYLDVSFSGCHYMEKQLIQEFDRLYIQRADIGRESYEGDLEKMKATFLRIVTATDHLTEVVQNPIRNIFYRTLIYSWRLIIK
jgi:hypothetical protein